MKKVIVASILALVSFVVISNGPTNAQSSDICFVESDGAVGSVGTMDFYISDDGINPGALIDNGGYVPNINCFAITCPEGFFLVSGNYCAQTDPFAHLPMEDDLVESITSKASISFSTPVDILPFAPVGYVVPGL